LNNEEAIVQAIKALITQVVELSNSHVMLMRFFLSTSPALSESERQAVLFAIDGFEVRQRHLLIELQNLQDLL